MIESFGLLAESFAELTASFGALGLLFFVAVYVLVVLLFLPITPFSMAAGVIFGWWGIPIVYLSAVLGSLIGFTIARDFGNSYIARLCEQRPIVKALEQVVVKGGFRLILLVRLSGILPFAVQNYAFGLTAVNRCKYISASLIGLIPGAVIKVCIGKVGMDVLDGSLWSNGIHTLGLICALLTTLIMLVFVGVLARRELQNQGISLTSSQSAAH